MSGDDPITKTGKVLHPWDIEALADEAEAGYDITHLLVRQRDAERALADRIVAAWTVPGINPAHHHRMQESLGAAWPVLYKAIIELVQSREGR